MITWKMELWINGKGEAYVYDACGECVVEFLLAEIYNGVDWCGREKSVRSTTKGMDGWDDGALVLLDD
ncbi:hypothetical protein H5410_036980 [Solanum commersonii]|uniref:Uncharacterized protein n=1 Tax=Solanum commersonii TaxID=4109 RepID=A0A9J5Y8Z3_SOLCO|nr:hypothetical protein H5410_036980 [Solanum commersonii]